MKTNFKGIQFNKEYFSYTLNGQRLTSVSKKLGEIKPPFDADAIAARVAAKSGQSVDEVKAEWQAKRDYGTMVHEKIARILRGEGESVGDHPFLSLNKTTPEVEQFQTLWSELSQGVEVAEVEWVIGDGELKLAGTVDALLYRGETGTHSIWDWKTGRFNLENNFEQLLPPFDDLSASEFNTYSLQLSLYRLIVERNTGLAFEDSYIVHLTPSGFEIHQALDLRERLEAWLSG